MIPNVWHSGEKQYYGDSEKISGSQDLGEGGMIRWNTEDF